MNSWFFFFHYSRFKCSNTLVIYIWSIEKDLNSWNFPSALRNASILGQYCHTVISCCCIQRGKSQRWQDVWLRRVNTVTELYSWKQTRTRYNFDFVILGIAMSSTISVLEAHKLRPLQVHHVNKKGHDGDLRVSSTLQQIHFLQCMS